MTNLYRNKSGQWFIYKNDDGWTVLSGFEPAKKPRIENFNIYLHTESSDNSVFDLVVRDVNDLLGCYQYEPGQVCKNLVTGEIEFEAERSREWLEKNTKWISL